MIRILVCPRCAKKLRLDDSRDMKAGKCPGCGQKFRIPKPVTAQAPSPPPVPPPVPRPAPAAPVLAQHIPPPPEAAPHPPVPPPPPMAEFRPPAALPSPQLAIPEADILPLDEPLPPGQLATPDGVGYNLAAGPGPSPDYIPEAQVVDEFITNVLEETGYGPAGGKRRKKKRKRKSTAMTLETGNLIISSCVMGVFWLVVLIILIVNPMAWPIIMWIGAGIFAIGQSWFVRSVLDDGIETALMCMFVPVYAEIYLIGNVDRVGKQYAIRMAGVLIMVTAAIAWAFSPEQDLHVTDAVNRPPLSSPQLVQPAPLLVASQSDKRLGRPDLMSFDDQNR